MTGLGAFGESWAVGYLTRRGYRVVDRNVRYRQGEIDIVAYDGLELVFVEVKCRRSQRFGVPADAITARRYQHLADAAARYLSDKKLETAPHRVDVVAIEVGRDGRVTRCDLLRAVEAPVE